MQLSAAELGVMVVAESRPEAWVAAEGQGCVKGYTNVGYMHNTHMTPLGIMTPEQDLNRHSDSASCPAAGTQQGPWAAPHWAAQEAARQSQAPG